MAQKTKVLFLVRASILFVVSFCFSFSALAGPYLDSTHGDTSNGVNRSSMTGYATGNCGHCHEQHATDLAGGPYNYSLFFNNYTSITPAPPVGLCFKCHDGTANEQSSSFSNYSYSYRAGNWGGIPRQQSQQHCRFFRSDPTTDSLLSPS
jgi:cytochrome c553